MTSLAQPIRSSLSPRDFDRIRKLAYDYCGLDIETGKEELVASRLGKIMRTLGIATYGEYYDYVIADKSQQALVTMIDNLTTNHTSFFREQQHFDFLTSRIFPALVGRPEITIWSAACSSGEEPYSLAIAAREYFGAQASSVRILATDISTRILDTARRATYDSARLRGVAQGLLHRHFLRGKGELHDLYRLKPELRSMIEFTRLNLTEPFGAVRTTFPLILCRNVMIYFNAQTQQDLVARFYEKLEPGGFLFIGHSESLNRIEHRFEYICPAVYRRPGTLKASTMRGRAA